MSSESYYASGYSGLDFTYDPSYNKKGRATFSATATGSSFDETIDTLKNVLKENETQYLIDNPYFTYQSSLNFNFNSELVTEPKLTLYYFIEVENKTITNQSILKFDTSENTLSGLQNQHMSNSNFTEYNNDLISFLTYRVLGNDELNLLPIITCNVSIVSDGSFVNGQNLYSNYGDSFTSSIKYILLNITTTSGKFSGFKYFKITFDNSDPNFYKRTVEFF